ncbi:sulfotransferase [Arhodomonas aquaeolei]|uniref:sulfotransferase n=1 Tax=Arhodomonas aquaeolei TaxID=2369 RepID=UPI0012EC7A63|nr:sulfotransferase [Arhodomonas aquaeolei]
MEKAFRYPDLGGEKIFCIGRNKTGTTTMAKALRELGYRLAPQRYAELLSDDFYLKGEFGPIVEFCKYYNAFQDVPFSWPDTYRVLDEAFPNARFILTVRDSAEQWYWSLIRFQSKRFGKQGSVPTEADLRAAEYVRPGFVYRAKSVWGNQGEKLYDRDWLIETYLAFNAEVEHHFAGREGKLLIVNVSDSQDYRRLCDFLGREPVRSDFPWENRT